MVPAILGTGTDEAPCGPVAGCPGARKAYSAFRAGYDGPCCVSSPCCRVASVCEYVSEAQTFRQVEQDHHMLCVGTAAAIHPSKDGMAVGSDAPCNVRPRQAGLFLEPSETLREVVGEVISRSVVVSALSRYRAGPSETHVVFAPAYVNAKIMSESSRRNESLSLNCLYSSAWSAR